MITLHRYIFKEHIGPFFFGFSIITFILIMDFIIDLFDLIINKGLGVKGVSEVFFLNLAWMVALSIPMSVLVATLMAFGRLSADNEVTAIKAGGISLYRMIITPLILAMAIAAFLVWFNDQVLPEANHRARVLMSAIHRKRPSISLKDKEGMFINDFPGYGLLIEKVNERTSELKEVTIYDQRNQGFPVTIRAKKGRMRFSPDGERLTIYLFDGEIHEVDPSDPTQYRRFTFEKYSLNLDCKGTKLKPSDTGYRGDREMSISMMRQRIAKFQREIDFHRQRILSLAQNYLKKSLSRTGSIGTSRDWVQKDLTPIAHLVNYPLSLEDRKAIQQLQNELRLLANKQKQVNRYLVEIHKKYSIPAACIVFVLIGAPLGVMARRGGWTVGLGISLIFFLIYWAFLIGGEELADRGIVTAFWAMWTPNFLIGGAGIYLIFHMVKETTFIHWERLRIIKRKPES